MVTKLGVGGHGLEVMGHFFLEQILGPTIDVGDINVFLIVQFSCGNIAHMFHQHVHVFSDWYLP